MKTTNLMSLPAEENIKGNIVEENYRKLEGIPKN
jgi:hypothetical protein